jgi:MFS family permease
MMNLPIQTKLRVFLPFAWGYFLSYLYRVVNAVIGPSLVAELNIGPSQLGLLTATYFITFAALQLPLGLLLDRFGPRKIEAALLLLAALGAFIFSQATSTLGLIVGRGLIGFGVSACLMAAFKAFVMWFPKRQLPMINGLQMGAGGLGALAATAPVEALLGITTWRNVFLLLSVMTLLVSGVVWGVVPSQKLSKTPPRFKEQLKGLRQVFQSREFWCIVPWTTMSQATFLSIQGLWAGPWLRDVAHLSGTQAATVLLWVAAAMVAGFVSLGFLAERLGQYGFKPVTVAATGMFSFMLVQACIFLIGPGHHILLWLLFGVFGTTGIISYADLSQRFPAELSGRVNTALNLLVFIAAFASQWGIGAIINLWPPTQAGGYAPQGYLAGFSTMWLLQAATMGWFLLSGRRLLFRRDPH